MTKKPTVSTEARDLRALLAVVVDALTLPHDTPDYEQRIDARARLARVVVGEALNEDPADLGWNTDFLRSKLTAEQDEAAERAKNQCARCRHPFNPADTAFDGRSRHQDTRWCRRCIDNCADGGTEHACLICDPKRYGGGQ